MSPYSIFCRHKTCVQARELSPRRKKHFLHVHIQFLLRPEALIHVLEESSFWTHRLCGDDHLQETNQRKTKRDFWLIETWHKDIHTVNQILLVKQTLMKYKMQQIFVFHQPPNNEVLNVFLNNICCCTLTDGMTSYAKRFNIIWYQRWPAHLANFWQSRQISFVWFL